MTPRIKPQSDSYLIQIYNGEYARNDCYGHYRKMKINEKKGKQNKK